MKRHVQEPGVRKWSGDDLLELQSEGLDVADKFFSQFGDCVITGCAATENNVSAGLVSIGGMVMPFEGVKAEVFPIYLVKDEEHFDREYSDDVVRDIAVRYFVKAVYLQPEGVDYITITAEGSKRFFDNIKPEWLDDSLNDIKKQVDDLLKTDADLLESVELLLQITNQLEAFNAETDTRLTNLETLLNYIPTLENKPTEITLTYQSGEITHEFQIGQQCRVYDDIGKKYVFYQLFNIEDNRAVWKRTIDEINSLEVVNSLPVNTILRALPLAGNPFGEKWLECNGSVVYDIDYPDLGIEGLFEAWVKFCDADHSIGMGITKTDGIFTIVTSGFYNQPRYSKDNGTTWYTGLGYAHDSGYNHVLFGNGTFIILPDHLGGDKPHWSEDGKIWTKAETAVARDYRGGCFGNDVFVVAADSDKGAFYASRDYGRTWTQTSTGMTEVSFGCNVCFGNGRFVILNRNKVATSTDGITWQYETISIGAAEINVVCYGNGIYIAIDRNCNVYRSENLLSWVQVTSLPVSIEYIPVSMAYGNGAFYVYAWLSSVGRQMYTRDNGLSWELLPAEGSGNSRSDIYYFKEMETVLFADSRASIHSLRKEKKLPEIENHFIKALK